MALEQHPEAQYSTCDARLIWADYKHSAPELYTMAMALLSLAASEAAVERSFSAQPDVHSKKRNALLDEHIENE